MTIISYSLIKKYCSHVLDAVSTPDGDHEVLILNNLEINEMDGLEIVSHIAELHLSHNHIQKIENIEFLSSLRVLDLSHNQITSNSLRECLTKLPRSLNSINLLNNPCCQDENVLNQLQDMYPSLGIIVGYEEASITCDSDEEEDNNEDNEQDDNEEVENATLPSSAEFGQSRTVDDETNLLKYEPLSADDILKQIVERKCRHTDTIHPFSLETVTLDLEKERDYAITQVTNRYQVHGDTSNNLSSTSKSEVDIYADRLMELSKSNREGSSAFLERLRETSKQTREKLMSPHS